MMTTKLRKEKLKKIRIGLSSLPLEVFRNISPEKVRIFTLGT